jgi:hypothetical protein
MLVSGIDLAVLCAALVAGWLVLRRLTKRAVADGRVVANDASNGHTASPNIDSVLPLLVFFFPFLALLVVAYLMHQQPIIFPRYGLILFGVGIPILAWTYFAIVRERPQWSKRLLIVIVALCVLNACAQFAGGVGELNRYAAQRRVADYLRQHFDANSNAKIFCDEGTVRALSGIPEDRFVTSSDIPKDHDGFWSALMTNNVEWLVIAQQPGSTPANFFPRFEYGDPVGPFESVMQARSKFLPLSVQVYRRIQ